MASQPVPVSFVIDDNIMHILANANASAKPMPLPMPMHDAKCQHHTCGKNMPKPPGATANTNSKFDKNRKRFVPFIYQINFVAFMINMEYKIS